jgi:hypothetical protein
MSNDKTPPTPTDGGQAAVEYVNQQLETARSSLGRTKLVAVIIILLVLSYMTFVTKGILEHLEPKQAAGTAKGLIATHLSEQGESLVGTLKERIPALMHDLPDAVLERVPEIRRDIEDRVEGQLRNYATLTAKELEPQFEAFLVEHKDDIKSFLEASQNLDELREDLNPDMDKLLTEFLNAHNDGEESLMEKFQASKVLLNGIAEQTERLAKGTDLTDREKQTRRAIAVLLAKADFKLYEATRDHDPEDDPDEKTTPTVEEN